MTTGADDMRQKQTRQMSLFSATARHDIEQELKEISKVLDDTPQMLDQVYNDLIRNRRHETGREGMTAEQVLRSCVLKQFRCLSYEELAFHLEDSNSFRAFARVEMGQYPSSSTLQENIKPISEKSWEAIHICLMRYVQKFGIENGRKMRIDSTAVETDVHDPTDASLGTASESSPATLRKVTPLILAPTIATAITCEWQRNVCSRW